MKKVGIIGGAGPLASALLYETIIQESYRQRGQVPEILLINYPFTRGLTLEEGKQNERILQEELNYCMNTLIQHHVRIGIVACNTLHRYLQVSPLSPLSFLHLPTLVIQEAQKNRHHRLLLLGTQNTCQSHLYRHPEITLLYPLLEQQRLLDNVINHILEGKMDPADSETISQLIQELSEQMSFDGVILGCTDLPVLHHHHPILAHQPLYDSIKIPAKRLTLIL